MALKIETFSNAKGGNAFFKAIGHPLAAREVPEFLAALSDGPVALYDPRGFATAFAEIYDLAGLDIAGVFVQDLEEIGKTILGRQAQPITKLAAAKARKLLVMAFDAERLIAQIRHLLPDPGVDVVSLDALRLPGDMCLADGPYLQRLNFATDFVFFRDANGLHTRLVTANYWSNYGAQDPELLCCLLSESGQIIAEWRDPLPGAGGTIVIDSAEVRARFGLGDFTGQLFLHVLKPAGHDIIKYALDTYGDRPEELSCTHDANPWPADLYAGLPAPQAGEEVVLWIQNSHPKAIPAGSVGLNLMGLAEVAWLDREVPPFGLSALNVADLLPAARWPQQIEVQAGKHFVRPRYEVVAEGGRRHIAHANVERTDLKPDPEIPGLANLMGKGYILPAPILPRGAYRSWVLPTPMATGQDSLPVAVTAYDPEGAELGRHSLGNLPRNHQTLLDATELLGKACDWGHLELTYDFAQGGAADGWLHGLFRYEDRQTGHAAETSFGAHMFNTVLTYRNEPQSYAGPAPGLSTRLFLRLGAAPLRTLCHLIYPASTPWHAASSTSLILYGGAGTEIARRDLAIPCGGSRLWYPDRIFTTDEISEAGDSGYILVRDLTCRLFGYHGLLREGSAFSLDHMFGF